MAASGEVTIAQDGGPGNVKLHPYLVALVRWCVSCVWSTATLLVHRLIAGSLPAPVGFTVKPMQKARAAGKEHLHPEPLVECQVLHAPEKHSLDVVFVHGLYGSLGNTWRQGDWRSKYKMVPHVVPLLRPTACKCDGKSNENNYKINESTYEINYNEISYDIEHSGYSDIKRLIPNEESFITEKFYDQAIMDQVEIVDNLETQAKFVRDLFESENRICDDNDKLNYEHEINEASKMNEVCKCKIEVDCKVDAVVNKDEVGCECKVSQRRKCEVGCGCVCDDCYSTCWPRDWIREDYPEARVISINYTSDPYLWRPLWIRECKRLRLHERADQMTRQLLELGVGKKPVIWVGHSKGGLFIKQIYCEAYEAYTKYLNNSQCIANTKIANDIENYNENDIKDIQNNVDTNESNFYDETVSVDINENSGVKNIPRSENEEATLEGTNENLDQQKSSSYNEEDQYVLKQGNLWRESAGFMFYSVPHRGSPLADIKTPITSRSIELLEISKDNSLVLSLQDRWLKATESSKPQVRSLVETCRTLMSVLWLRIVSVPSADAGIGALSGVSVDHREICKPSSRNCLLYKELMALMRASLNQCRCDT